MDGVAAGLLTDIRFVPADTVPVEVVWRAFVDGFAGYIVPVNVTLDQFTDMLRAELVRLDASTVALGTNGAPVGVTLLAIRDRTCWCSGLGVAPQARRQGIGHRLVQSMIDKARERGLHRLRLECIDGNHAARALYDGMGFRALRRLDIFKGTADRAPVSPTDSRVVALNNPQAVWRRFADYHPRHLPWQSELPSLRNIAAARAEKGVGSPRCLCLGDPVFPTAYLLLFDRGESTQIFDYGTLRGRPHPIDDLMSLVVHFVMSHPRQVLTAHNIPEASPLNSVLRAAGVSLYVSQTEMALDL